MRPLAADEAEIVLRIRFPKSDEVKRNVALNIAHEAADAADDCDLSAYVERDPF